MAPEITGGTGGAVHRATPHARRVVSAGVNFCWNDLAAEIRCILLSRITISIAVGGVRVISGAAISGLTIEILALAQVAAGVRHAIVIIEVHIARIDTENVEEAISMIVAIWLTPTFFTEPERTAIAGVPRACSWVR